MSGVHFLWVAAAKRQSPSGHRFARPPSHFVGRLLRPKAAEKAPRFAGSWPSLRGLRGFAAFAAFPGGINPSPTADPGPRGYGKAAGRACPAPTTAANKKIPVHTCLSPAALHKFYITFTLPWWCSLCAYIIIESGIVKTKQRMDV